MRLSDYVMNTLAKEGVRNIFMVSGGGVMYLDDALGIHPKIQHICNHHEQACALAAEGCARVNDGIGALLVSTGPAGTNAVTGIACSWQDSIPVIGISGQVKSSFLIGGSGLRQNGTQEGDIVSIVKSITKYAAIVLKAEEIKYHLEKAIWLAKNGRPGPVWLDIPLDVQQAQIDPKKLKGFTPPKVKKTNLKLDKIAALLKKAKRPIFLAGGGIAQAKIQKEFLALAEEFQIPVATAKNGFDIIWDAHPLLAGRVGINGQRAANLAVQNADLILVTGTHLPFVVTGYETALFGKNAKIVLVDVDPAQIKHCHIKPHLAVNADFKEFIPKLHKYLKKAKYAYPSDYWVKRVQQYRADYPQVSKEQKQVKDYVNSYHFFDVLSDYVSADDIITADQGAAFYSFTTAFKNKKGQKAFTNGGFSTMGYGIGAAIGACFAPKVDNVVCVHGDGGLQMNIQELQTIKHYNLPIKLFVFNNEGYLSIKHTQTAFFNGRLVGSDPKSGVSCPDTVKIAQAYGLKTFRITNHKELKNKLKQIMAVKGPVVIEVLLDPMQPYTPKTVSKRLPDGRMVSPALHEMAPFLAEEEMRKNMTHPK